MKRLPNHVLPLISRHLSYRNASAMADASRDIRRGVRASLSNRIQHDVEVAASNLLGAVQSCFRILLSNRRAGRTNSHAVVGSPVAAMGTMVNVEAFLHGATYEVHFIWPGRRVTYVLSRGLRIEDTTTMGVIGSKMEGVLAMVENYMTPWLRSLL